jgi:selenocysteine-specific translation elongation factor
MGKIGVFKIESSFKLRGRGLVALGQIIEGRAKVGSYLTFKVNDFNHCMQISGVEMADINREKGEFAVGLTFVYADKDQQIEFEMLMLTEQLADITDEKQKVIDKRLI